MGRGVVRFAWIVAFSLAQTVGFSALAEEVVQPDAVDGELPESAEASPTPPLVPPPPVEEPQESFTQNDEPDPRALELYVQAEDAYDEGRYQDAVALLEEAVSHDPNAPDLLYNLALVYERLGNYDGALEYLQRYRQFQLGDEEQNRVDRMMVRIRGARAHAPAPPEPEVQTRVVTERIGVADGWFWGMLGATVLFGGAAIVTGVLALDWHGAAADYRLGTDGNLDDFHYMEDTAYYLSIVTDVLIGLSSAAALTALLLYVLRRRPVDGGEQETRATDNPAVPDVMIGPTGISLGWEM